MVEHTFGYPFEAIIFLIISFCISLYVDFRGHKAGHIMSVQEALLWSIGWIVVSCLFGLFIYIQYGGVFASLYFAGYIVEKTLSIDNIIVFSSIFSSFGIRSQELQHKILLWGIASAIVLRGIFTFLGANILALHWSIHLIFAAIIAYSGLSMLFRSETQEEIDYSKHKVVNLLRRYIPITKQLEGNALFIYKERLYATPAFICLCIIELSDILFAFDSVPAVFAITQEPFLVYSAMLFAIMGLRALYFVLQSLLDKLFYLEKSIVILLFFIAGKMALGAFGIHLPLWLSLGTILGIITLGVILSLLFPPRTHE
ncbi:MAG: TerC family protein [Desulfovibrionaceae bacterium]|nr:TerC family protein [Desulfovibrionaceae bacterium]